MTTTVETPVQGQKPEVVEVPDPAHQIILILAARRHGAAGASIPGRSGGQVTLTGPAAKVRSAIADAGRMCMELEGRRLRVLWKVLQANGFDAAFEFGRALAGVGSKVAFGLDRRPAAETRASIARETLSPDQQ